MPTPRKTTKTSQSKSIHDPIERFGADPDGPVAMIKTADGRALMLPSSVSKLRGAALELIVELQDQAAAVHAAQERLDALVEECRGEGVSWVAVGFSVGLSPQGARQRWGPEPATPDRPARSTRKASGSR